MIKVYQNEELILKTSKIKFSYIKYLKSGFNYVKTRLVNTKQIDKLTIDEIKNDGYAIFINDQVFDIKKFNFINKDVNIYI